MLKPPMTSLQGMVQLARRQLAQHGALDQDRAARTLRIFDEQTGKLTRLVNQLLDVSRIEAGKLAIDRTETDLVAASRLSC